MLPTLPPYPDSYLLFGMIFAVSNRLQVIGDRFYQEITAKQWFVLVTLELFGQEHPTLNELSDAVGSSHQNVKQLVLKLQQKGYVQLYTDVRDRRKSRVAKTDKCAELASAYHEKETEFIKQLFAGTQPDELKSTLRVLMTLEKNMENMQE